MIGIFLQSCGSQRSTLSGNDNITDNSPNEVVEENPNIAPRRTFMEDVTNNLLDNDNLTKQQKKFVKNAKKVMEKKTYHLTLEQDGIEVEVVIFDDKARVLMSMEDIQKINNTYRMTEILEELVDKYNIENELNLTIIQSLTNEVVLLNEKITLLNDELQNKDQIISTLEATVAELRESNDILTEVNGLQAETIKTQKKEIRKQKNQKTIIAIGGGIIITLLLLSGI